MDARSEVALWRHQVEMTGELSLSRANTRKLMAYAELGAERVPDKTDLTQPELPLFGPQPMPETVRLVVT